MDTQINKLQVGDRVSLFAKSKDVRLGIGDVVAMFKNAVDVNLIESRMVVGPFGVKRFFPADTWVIK